MYGTEVRGLRHSVLRNLALSIPQPTLLIVDDNPDCRCILTAICAHHGYDCVEAENGVAALALLQRNAIDLILLDYEMPRMNGCEFLEALERTVDHPPPAVMITGNLLEAVWKRAIAAGAKAVLSKPYECTTLLSVVGNHLQPGAKEREIFSNMRNPCVVQDPVESGGRWN